LNLRIDIRENLYKHPQKYGKREEIDIIRGREKHSLVDSASNPIWGPDAFVNILQSKPLLKKKKLSFNSQTNKGI